VVNLGPRGGTARGAAWRRGYKEQKPPEKTVRFLWAFTEGVQPNAAHGSIFSMHCSGIWHGKRVDHGHAVKNTAAESAAPAGKGRKKQTPSSSSSSSAPSPARKSKAKRGASVPIVDAEDPMMEDKDDDAGVPPLCDLNETESQAPRAPSSSKRQKTAAAVTSAATTAAATPTRASNSTAAAAAATPTAALASGPATRPLRGQQRGSTGAPAAAATAAAAAPVALSGSSAALVESSTNASTMGVMMQFMQNTQAAFLAAQARTEERAAASELATREANMEMLRLSQAGQQSIVQLVRVPGEHWMEQNAGNALRCTDFVLVLALCCMLQVQSVTPMLQQRMISGPNRSAASPAAARTSVSRTLPRRRLKLCAGHGLIEQCA